MDTPQNDTLNRIRTGFIFCNMVQVEEALATNPLIIN